LLLQILQYKICKALCCRGFRGESGRRHLGFSKIRNFNGQSAVRGQYASSCQITSKSVKRLQRYGDLTVFFKMAAVRHLGFVGRVLRPPTMTTWQSISVQNLVEIDAVVSIL